MLDLASLGLSQAQKERRRRFIGGSDAPKIMAGGEAAYDLWLEKTGRREPEDLSGVLPVMMGHVTEPFNVAWYSKMTGRPVADCGRHMVDIDQPWRSVTLDGMTTTEDGRDAVLQCKHVNAFTNLPEVVSRYLPQLTHEASVMRTKSSVISVLFGNLKWECMTVELDWIYAAELLERERHFWRYVVENREPDFKPVEAPLVKFSEYRTQDMSGSNEWASLAFDWLTLKADAEKFEETKKALKALIPSDVGLATGHGISASRDKKGAVTIREFKERANVQ